MWIKICANTTLEDAQYAARAGADAVGFVFAPSKRQVGAAAVGSITTHLPATIERVGVFLGTEEPLVVAEIARTAGLTAIQIHGGLDLPWASRLRRHLSSSISLIHTVPWELGDSSAAQRVQAQLSELLDAGLGERVLIDAKLGVSSGGLGVSFDWQAAEAVLGRFARDLPIIVAGGLRPDNVVQAIDLLRPFGVDVASGVEASPGIKDPAKVASFIENARRA